MIAERQNLQRHMSSQKFSAAEREAIYRAHDGKCAYTRQLLDLASFHIDHVLPEDLAADQTALAEVKRKLNLDETFDLFGYENLLPATPGANMQKGPRVFSPDDCRFYLGIAAVKKPDVLKHLGAIERRNTKGKALVLLAEAVESGKMTRAEVAQMLELYSAEPEGVFELLRAVDFGDSEYVDKIAKADIDSLRDRPVLGTSEVLELTHFSMAKRPVRTCREYELAISEGYYASTTYDIKTATRFVHKAELLTALERAATPTQSFIDSPRVSVADLHRLPFRLFPDLSSERSEEEMMKTYQDKVDEGELVIKTVRQNLLVVEGVGMGQQLMEVARADFNGDGIEDVLVFEYAWATGGTFGAGSIRILTRKSADGLFEEVHI